MIYILSRHNTEISFLDIILVCNLSFPRRFCVFRIIINRKQFYRTLISIWNDVRKFGCCNRGKGKTHYWPVILSPLFALEITISYSVYFLCKIIKHKKYYFRFKYFSCIVYNRVSRRYIYFFNLIFLQQYFCLIKSYQKIH